MLCVTKIAKNIRCAFHNPREDDTTRLHHRRRRPAFVLLPLFVVVVVASASRQVAWFLWVAASFVCESFQMSPLLPDPFLRL